MNDAFCFHFARTACTTVWLRTSLLQLANATQKVPVYPRSHTKNANTLCGEKSRVYKRYSTFIYHGALRGQKRTHKKILIPYTAPIRGSDSRWSHWNFSLIQTFRPHYGPGVDSVSYRNEHQEYFLGGTRGRCVGITTLPP